MAITNFDSYGLNIVGNNNVVSCSWIGTADEGTTAAANGAGVFINGSNNSLGIANIPTSGNLISGNSDLGITAVNGSNNTLYYNWIGLQSNGTSALLNSGGILTFGGGQLVFKPGNKIKS